MLCSHKLSKPVYAKNYVVQMRSTHAYNHTLGAHLLTQQSLASTLLSQGSITQLRRISEDGLHERCMADVVHDTGVDTTMYAKTCLLTLLPWIWKPSFRSGFSILSHWFNISSSQNAHEAGPYFLISHHKRDCIHFVENLNTNFFPDRPEAQLNSWCLGGRESLVIGKKLEHFTESKTRIQYNRNSNKRKWPDTRTYWISWLLMAWRLAAPRHQ